ncbi:hypothetical protein [Streptomyces sp. NPDC056081]|uniref:hypothetical protein n=1 Tax=unclassified Streptomyces TaxID=2593676 RepID=UPI0035DF65EF
MPETHRAAMAAPVMSMSPTAARLALLAESTERDPRDFGGRDLIAALAGDVCPAAAPGEGCTAKGDIRNITYADEQARAVPALLRAGETRTPHRSTG